MDKNRYGASESLVRRGLEELNVAIRTFRADFQSRDSIEWDRYRPLLEGAAARIADQYAEGTGRQSATELHSVLREIFPNLIPWTSRDYLSAGLVALSICIVIAAPGLGIALATAASIGIDVAGTAADLFLAHRENVQRGQLSVLGMIDPALRIASPAIDLRTEAAIQAMLLVTPEVISRAGRAIVGRLARATTVATGEVVNAERLTHSVRLSTEAPSGRELTQTSRATQPPTLVDKSRSVIRLINVPRFLLRTAWFAKRGRQRPCLYLPNGGLPRHRQAHGVGEGANLPPS